MLNPIKLANKNFLSSLDTSSEEFFHILEIAKVLKTRFKPEAQRQGVRSYF